MKLGDKQKKWMIIGSAVIVCMILVLLIAGQFKSEPAAVQETTQADKTTVAEPMIESSEEVRETVKVETKAETTAAPAKDQTDETVQQIQPEVTKPAMPKDEDRHDPTKKPNGETVTVTPINPVVAEPQPTPETEPPVVTEPQPVEQPTEPPTEATESVPQEGKIYVPGFGWMDDTGEIGIQVDSDGDINKQVGIMD